MCRLCVHPLPRSLGTTVFFYMLISALGYLALGDAVPDNVLLVRARPRLLAAGSWGQGSLRDALHSPWAR